MAVTADRRAEEQATLLEQLGARTVLGSMIYTAPLGEGAPLRAATQQLIDDPCDVLIATIGIGVRGWFTSARAWGLDQELTRALASARIAVRGHKARAALREADLTIWREEPTERLEKLIDHLIATEAPGTHIALQQSGVPAPATVQRLVDAGMRVTVVPVYEWTLPVDLAAAQRLVVAAAERTVDAVTFTSSPAAVNFFELASSLGIADSVREALNTSVVPVAVGPATLEVLRDLGALTARAPESGRLGLMVHELTVAMADRHEHFDVETVAVTIQGTAVATDEGEVELVGREREVFDALAARPGGVVSTTTLLRGVWGRSTDDDQVVTKAVSRLRVHLEPIGLSVRNTAKRGYSLNALGLRRASSGALAGC